MQRRSIHLRGWTSDVLARCGPDELLQARASRDLLLASARGLVAIIGHDPDRAECTDAGCALAGDPDDERCGLVHRLASIVEEDRERAVPHVESLEAATRRFEVALTEVVAAVRRCRQTEHGAGRCWFASLPDVDGCGEVLRAAHRLG